MALDIQTIAMTGDYLPYERPPQPLTLWSAIPRGLQSFVVDSQLLDVKVLNDDALLQLQATLPPNFGYVMADAQVTIAQNRAFDWTNECVLNLQNFYRAQVALSVALSIDWFHDFPVDGQALDRRTLRSRGGANSWPSFPIIGTPGTSGIQIQLSMFNNIDAATTAGTVNAYISFWVFDLEQIRKYPINSPFPVHTR